MQELSYPVGTAVNTGEPLDPRDDDHDGIHRSSAWTAQQYFRRVMRVPGGVRIVRRSKKSSEEINGATWSAMQNAALAVNRASFSDFASAMQQFDLLPGLRMGTYLALAASPLVRAQSKDGNPTQDELIGLTGEILPRLQTLMRADSSVTFRVISDLASGQRETILDDPKYLIYMAGIFGALLSPVEIEIQLEEIRETLVRTVSALARFDPPKFRYLIE